MTTGGFLKAPELAEKIKAGGRFFLAGAEELLRQLPNGAWIGGTTPYFLTGQGGALPRDEVYALELPAFVTGAEIKVYDARSLAGVYKEAPENGFSLIVIPASSATHLAFAMEAPAYEDFASSPLIGWISGVPLEELGKRSPLVFDGRTGAALADAAVVLHAALPRGKTARIGLVNIFEPADGDALSFPASGFSSREVLVNGRARPFLEYLEEKKLDTRLPLVADYGGARINVAFQKVDAAAGEVSFYGPVFSGVEYRHARPVGNYQEAFAVRKPEGTGDRLAFSCNCILNYLYAGLEGKPAAGFPGPVTFGEVAYQLLNQTEVYLEITDTNLAAQLRGETERRRRAQLLETLLETIPAPVFYKDAAGRYLGCNKAYEELTGLPRGGILGRTAAELFPAELAAVYARKDLEMLDRPEGLTFELEVPGPSGEPRHLIFHKAAFRDPGGRPGGLICAITDVTALKRAEESMAKAYETLKVAQDRLVQSEKMSAVGQLAAGVAHEINNPLGIILGFAQGLASRTPEGDPLEVPLRSIERETMRCRDLVKELLLFSRTSEGEEAELDLNAAVDAALALTGPSLERRGIVLRRETALLPGICANRSQIGQVVINLLNNAADAAAAGGTVVVRTALRGGDPACAELEVRDDGAGIPESVKGRIFEPFFTTRAVGKGRGLGLSMVYEIVKKHNGTIELETAEGKGSSFHILLPLAAPGGHCVKNL